MLNERTLLNIEGSTFLQDAILRLYSIPVLRSVTMETNINLKFLSEQSAVNILHTKKVINFNFVKVTQVLNNSPQASWFNSMYEQK